MSRGTWALATVATLASFACQPSGTPAKTTPAADQGGDVIAHVGDTVITAQQMKERLEELPPLQRPRYTNAAQKKEFVENMIKFEILSREAIKKGLDKTPSVESQFKRVLVQDLQKSFNDQKVEVSDDDLKKYYDKHIDDYVKPEKVRVQHIFLSAPEGGDAKAKQARAQARSKAAGFLTKLKAAQAAALKTPTPLTATSPLPAMTDLARQESADNSSKAVGGDLRFQSQADLTKQFSAEFAQAAFALTTDAPLSGVIETPKGFHIARLLGRQAATNQPFDDPKFKTALTDRYLAESRTARFDEYYQGLKKAANVSIDEAVLAKVEVPKGTGSTPAPGTSARPLSPPQASSIPGGSLPHPLPANARPPLPVNHAPVAGGAGHP
jgi:peptidyl-prolyl cis-trans isomerase C